MRRVYIIILLMLITVPLAGASKILIPMDITQTDHLKAYGVAYWCLEYGVDVEWLLNYRGGSFLSDDLPQIVEVCRLKGVSFEQITGAQEAEIKKTVEDSNMESVLLEKPPKIAIYAPPASKNEPWDDAVNLALTYAEIPFDIVWDPDVLAGKLHEYDWVHLHHEDFTGQFGKFFAAYRNTMWYKQDKALNERTARELGFSKVSKLKLAVVDAIDQYVAEGGFLFGMCSATDTYDIARSARKTDIVPSEFDGDAVDPGCNSQLDFTRTLAFENFEVITNPLIYEHSNIDTSPARGTPGLTPETDYFSIFNFSAKWDPVPTMLTQDHTQIVNGFWGQCTGFNKQLLKKHVTILAETEGKNEAKYIHGNYGRGTFTFLGGHDPEDYQHMIGDPPSDLSLHKHSPGYRLILNNVLFPAAKKKERKT
ncbi:MAG: asparagine synthetase B [candidate division Zixibacteria bacterium RBG_16_53_22]|nr:MAG: asparagine synthetase B [candidate division Zixibacteria bacterium RBG_16_53_22]